MNSTASHYAQGERDANLLIAGENVHAHARFMNHSGDVSVGATDVNLAYFAGFRAVVDAHLATVEHDTVNSDSPDGLIAIVGEFEVFREGADYVFYNETEEVLCYAAPTAGNAAPVASADKVRVIDAINADIWGAVLHAEIAGIEAESNVGEAVVKLCLRVESVLNIASELEDGGIESDVRQAFIHATVVQARVWYFG